MLKKINEISMKIGAEIRTYTDQGDFESASAALYPLQKLLEFGYNEV
jgi:hypothetical protein